MRIRRARAQPKDVARAKADDDQRDQHNTRDSNAPKPQRDTKPVLDRGGCSVAVADTLIWLPRRRLCPVAKLRAGGCGGCLGLPACSRCQGGAEQDHAFPSSVVTWWGTLPSNSIH